MLGKHAPAHTYIQDDLVQLHRQVMERDKLEKGRKVTGMERAIKKVGNGVVTRQRKMGETCEPSCS